MEQLRQRDANGAQRGLSSPSFVGLLATQFLGAMNDNMFRWFVVPIGIPILGGAEALSLGLVCFTVPYLLFATVAGYLADRFSKRHVIVGCKVAEIVLMLLGVGAILLGNIWLLFGVVAMMGCQSALFGPAKLGSIPEMLSGEKISSGNGLMGLVTIVASAIGTFAGFALYAATKPDLHNVGGLVEIWPAAAALIGVAVIGWGTSLLIARLPIADPDRQLPSNPVAETWRNLRLLGSNLPLFRTALGISFFWFLASLANVNINAFGLEVLGVAETQIGTLMVVLVVGVGLGSVLAGVWSGGKVELGIVPLGTVGIAVSTLMLFVAGRMTPRKLPVYVLGQFAGAFLAAGLLYLLFGPSIARFEQTHDILRGEPASIETAMMFGEYYPNPGAGENVSVTTVNAMCAEMVGTFALVFLIFSLSEGCNVGRPDDSLAPLFIGISLCMIISIVAPSLVASVASSAADAVRGRVKVFILAGQSNMEGKALASTLEPVIADAETHERFKHLKTDGAWTVRDDVWVTFLDKQSKGPSDEIPRYGPLSVGFGGHKLVRNEDGKKVPAPTIGPELGFGWLVGEHFDQPVLLIKAAWGGKSVKRDFRPPSDMPSDDELKETLEQAKKKNPDASFDEVKESYGKYYRKILEETRKVLDHLDEYVPEYEESLGYEIAGFVWFQGWNDGVGKGNPAYPQQLAAMIRDLRKDLNAPDLPVVIGELGVDGPDAEGWIVTFRNQQAAVAAMPEFKDNVRLARTAQFWPTKPDLSQQWEKFRAGAKENSEKPDSDPTKVREGDYFQKNWVQRYAKELAYTSDRRYHYKGSGACYYLMGEAMAKAMLEIVK